MYVVFSTGGKQYRASTGDIVKVEKLEAEKGTTVELDSVLMIGEGEDIQVGTPFLKGGKVTAKVVEHGRGDKIKVLKFKRRKNHMKKQGHRQFFTALEITGIDVAAPAPKKAPEVKEAAETPAKKPAAKKPAAKKTASKKAPAKKAAAKKTAGKKATSKKAASKKAAVDKAPAAKDKGDE
jgi:large subunit ribosomal protein L21